MTSKQNTEPHNIKHSSLPQCNTNPCFCNSIMSEAHPTQKNKINDNKGKFIFPYINTIQKELKTQ